MPSLRALSLIGAAYAYNRTVSYTGQRVLNCSYDNQAIVDALDNKLGLDIWDIGNGEVVIRVTPEQRPLVEETLSCQVMIADLERHVATMEFVERKAAAPKDFFSAYHTYDELIAFYKEKLSEYPNLMKMKAIGKSGQGNDMHAIVLTAAKTPQPRFYFQCQIHAREWISGITCAYVLEHLLSKYGKDDAVTRILDEAELHIIPFVNPDGFKYTWSNDRLWRKNRNPNTGSSCVGTDLNRNYNDHWNGGGSSNNPCSETYMGKAAASEIETQVTQNYFMSIPPVIGAIDWHSYSQLVLRPYGWTSADAPDEKRMKEIGDAISANILQVHGMRYTSQKSIQLYVTSGTANDWFYGKQATDGNQGYKAPGYTIELRDTGTYGFQLPPAQIIPQGQEIVPAVKYFLLTLLDSPIKA